MEEKDQRDVDDMIYVDEWRESEREDKADRPGPVCLCQSMIQFIIQ